MYKVGEKNSKKLKRSNISQIFQDWIEIPDEGNRT
jgi:hypothetical protein